MGKRRFLIVAGQDNALDAAHPGLFEDLHPYLALRTQDLVDHAGGAFDDLFEMQGEFLGGPTHDAAGTAVTGQWQQVNLRDAAVRSIRMLALWSPMATGASEQDSSGTVGPILPGLDYPGRAQVTEIVSGSEVRFGTVFQNTLPIDLVRQRTGRAYQATPTSIRSANLTFSEAFVPALEVGEVFTYKITAQAPISDTSLRLSVAFGGNVGASRLISGVQILGRATDPADPFGEQEVIFRAPVPVGDGDAIEFVQSPGAVLGGFPAGSGINMQTTLYAGTIDTVDPARGDLFASQPGVTMMHSVAHGLIHGERVRVVAKSPNLPIGEDVWRGPVEVNVGDVFVAHWGGFDRFAIGLDAVAISILRFDPPGDYWIEVEPIDREFMFTVANTRGGPAAKSTRQGVADVATTVAAYEGDSSFRASLSGLQVRAVGGANAGESRPIVGVTNDTANGMIAVEVDPAFPSLPAADDELVIEPPPLENGEPVPFERWAKFLPWSPFEGNAGSAEVQIEARLDAAGPVPVELSGIDGLQPGAALDVYDRQNHNDWTYCKELVYSAPNGGRIIQTMTPHLLDAGSQIRFTDHGGMPTNLVEDTLYAVREVLGPFAFVLTGNLALSGGANGGYAVHSVTTRLLPGNLHTGDRVYVHTVYPDGSASLSLTDGGPEILGRDIDAGSPILAAGNSATVYLTLAGAIDAGVRRHNNPYPPGFNYPTHWVIPGVYQPFDGPRTSGPRDTISIAVPLAYRLVNQLGGPIYVVNVAFPDSSVGHREIYAKQRPSLTVGWADTKQQISWAPSEQNNCFAVFENALDAAVTAFAEEENEGECLGIVWLQGDTDAEYVDLAQRYRANLEMLRDAMRTAVADRGLASGSPDRVPFLMVQIADDGAAPRQAVNDALRCAADGDDWSRLVEIEDLVDVGSHRGLEGGAQP